MTLRPTWSTVPSQVGLQRETQNKKIKIKKMKIINLSKVKSVAISDYKRLLSLRSGRL